MEVAGVVIAAVCALAIAGLTPFVMRAERQRAPHARLSSASLIAATVLLIAASLSAVMGAGRYDTGRFLFGMGVGAAVGLALGCGALLARDRR